MLTQKRKLGASQWHVHLHLDLTCPGNPYSTECFRYRSVSSIDKATMRSSSSNMYVILTNQVCNLSLAAVPAELCVISNGFQHRHHNRHEGRSRSRL